MKLFKYFLIHKAVYRMSLYIMPPTLNRKLCWNSRRYDKKVQATKRSRAKPEVKANAYKAKKRRSLQSTTEEARLAYGPDAIQCIPDVSEEELNKAKDDFYETVKVTDKQIKEIEAASKQQSYSAVWFSERAKRLTSSNFGQVITRKPSIAITPLVKKILYNKFKGNQFTNRGLNQEHEVGEKYRLHQAKAGEYIFAQI